jgi:glutamyl-tRNA reductase
MNIKYSSMRIKPDESLESWTQRVHEFELDWAKKELAKGVPVEQVLERMSERISQKLLHPILTALKENTVPVDIEASKKAYEKAYLKYNSPKPDHVSDD